MKVIGIDFDLNEAVIICLQKDGTSVSILETSIKKIGLKDHTDSEQVRQMRDLIFSFFDEYGANRIAIVKRLDSGKYSASPISFKIEGIMQLYSKKKIEIIPLKTIQAHIKINPAQTVTKFKYQANANLLANYLLA